MKEFLLDDVLDALLGGAFSEAWNKWRQESISHETKTQKSPAPQCPESEVRCLCGGFICELRIRKDTGRIVSPVWFRFESSLDEAEAAMKRTFEPPHWRAGLVSIAPIV